MKEWFVVGDVDGRPCAAIRYGETFVEALDTARKEVPEFECGTCFGAKVAAFGLTCPECAGTGRVTRTVKVRAAGRADGLGRAFANVSPGSSWVML